MTLRVRRAASTSMDARSSDRGAAELEVVVVEPGAFDADAGQHLDDPVDLLDPGQPAQRGGAAVDQAGAEQGDAGVLAAVDVHGAGERAAAFDPQVGHLGLAHLDDALAEDRLQPLDHFQAQVLLALLHPGDGALAGSQLGGELALGPALLARGRRGAGGQRVQQSLESYQENITDELSTRAITAGMASMSQGYPHRAITGAGVTVPSALARRRRGSRSPRRRPRRRRPRRCRRRPAAPRRPGR